MAFVPPAAPTVEPIDQLYQGLLSLAASQRETNILLTHLMEKPGAQNYLTAVPSISYLRETHSILLCSQAVQTKKLWCPDCRKKTLLQVNKEEKQAVSQCEHLRSCQACSIQTFEKLLRCPHCIPILHRSQNAPAEGDKCPVCSGNLHEPSNGSQRKHVVFNQLLSNFLVVVDTQNLAQCPHQGVVGVKRERADDSEYTSYDDSYQPKKITRIDSPGLIPSVRDGVLGMSKRALAVGTNFFSKMSETVEEDAQQESFLDGLL